MKQLSSKMKISIVVIIIIIIAGSVMIFTKGMNKTILYSEHTRLEITLNSLEKQKVEEISKEVFGKDVIIQTFGDFEDSMAISLKNPEEDKITQFNEKINELNGGEEVTITRVQVGRTSLKSIVTPYVLPMVIIVGIFAIYRAIKNRKDNCIKNLLLPVISSLVVSAVYVSLIALLRIEVGYYFMPLFVIVNILTLIITSTYHKKES